MFASHFANEHARNTNRIAGEIADFFSFADLLSAAVNGLVGIFVRRGAPSPFEEAHKIAANIEIPIGGRVTVGAEFGQEAVKRLLRK
jgi:hypothetical protein